MKSSVHNLFSASLYRVPRVACQLTGSSDLERSLLERDTWWIHWLVNSSNTEKVSLPLNLVCVSAVEKLSQQLKTSMFYLSLLWTSIWAMWSKCSSAQGGEHSGNTPWVTCDFTCVTTEGTSRSGMENLPQPRMYRYVSCEEKQSQKGVLSRKITDKKSGQCSTSVLIHGYLAGGVLQQWKQRNWQDRQNPFGSLGWGKLLLPGERT